MIRKHWRDPRFWLWWWRQRLSGDAKAGVAAVGIGLLGVGGYAAAGGLNDAVSDSSEPLAAQVTTVQRLVTVRESGQIEARPVRVVRTSAGGGSTSYETQVLQRTVTTPAGSRVVTRREVRTVPVVRRVVVTKDGRVQTVVQTRPGVTQVRTSVVTDQRTVTDERVLTSERVITQPVTITQVVTETTHRTETVQVPVTVVQTVLLPGVTITLGLP